MGDRHGMVVAPQPEAVESGVDALIQGGNAVDAAVACAMTQTVVDPMMCGIAGFGSMAIYTADDRTLRYVDFHSPAGSKATPDMWAHLIRGEAPDGFGFLLEGHVNELGYQSICVPATLRALYEAHERFGVLPWNRVVEDAISWAEEGWMVRPHVEEVWWSPAGNGHVPHRERVTFSPAGRRLYCGPNGTPKRAGDHVRNPEYAEVLRVISTTGLEDVYAGSIARAMIDDIEAQGGLLTADDLTRYRPRWSEPLWGTYRGYRMGTNRPPGGGAMLIEMLNILEGFDLGSLGHNSVDYVGVVTEAMRQATVDKDRYLGDPEFVEVPLDRLLSKDYAADVARRIRAGERVQVPRLDRPAESPNTTHASVIDADGSCVSLTHSLGIASGVITEGLGFMYNACMSVFDPRPGNTHSIAPGRCRFSSIVPTIAFLNGRPSLVIGAPGGTQIAMGVLQVVLNVLEFGYPIFRAILEPRFSATSNVIDVVNRFPRAVTDALEARGYPIRRLPESYGIALVHGIRVHEDGILEGGADPGADGMALRTPLAEHTRSRE